MRAVHRASALLRRSNCWTGARGARDSERSTDSHARHQSWLISPTAAAPQNPEKALVLGSECLVGLAITRHASKPSWLCCAAVAWPLGLAALTAELNPCDAHHNFGRAVVR
jgi:hypothetical protein